MEDEFERTVERRRELYRWGLLVKVSVGFGSERNRRTGGRGRRVRKEREMLIFSLDLIGLGNLSTWLRTMSRGTDLFLLLRPLLRIRTSLPLFTTSRRLELLERDEGTRS